MIGIFFSFLLIGTFIGTILGVAFGLFVLLAPAFVKLIGAVVRGFFGLFRHQPSI